MIKKFVEQVGNVSLPTGRGTKARTSFNGVDFMTKAANKKEVARQFIVWLSENSPDSLAEYVKKTEGELISLIEREIDSMFNAMQQQESELVPHPTHRIYLDAMNGSSYVCEQEGHKITAFDVEAYLSLVKGDDNQFVHYDWLFHKRQGAICSLDPSLKAADHDGTVDISRHPKAEEHRKSGLSLIGLNLFHPPEWRSIEVETPSECPPWFDDFMNHVFIGNRKTIDLVCEFIANTIFSKTTPPIAMHLMGAAGVGKSLLTTVIANLCGELNTIKYKGEGRFNSEYEHKLLVVVDEHKPSIDWFKSIVGNATIGKEKKHVEAAGHMPVTFNIIQTCNEGSLVPFSEDGRRNMLPNITNKTTIQAISEGTLKQGSFDIIRDLASPATAADKDEVKRNQAQLARYLHKRYYNEDFNQRKDLCIKTQTYYQCLLTRQYKGVKAMFETWLINELISWDFGEVRDFAYLKRKFQSDNNHNYSNVQPNEVLNSLNNIDYYGCSILDYTYDVEDSKYLVTSLCGKGAKYVKSPYDNSTINQETNEEQDDCLDLFDFDDDSEVIQASQEKKEFL